MPTKECAHWVLALYLVKRPGTHLHTLRSRPCKQMLAPPHTLHCGRRRPCMHTCDPPHSLHVARMRPCAQNDPPPAGGDSVSSEGRDSGRTGASLSPMAGRRERLRQRVLGRQRACKLSACAMMTEGRGVDGPRRSRRPWVGRSSAPAHSASAGLQRRPRWPPAVASGWRA